VALQNLQNLPERIARTPGKLRRGSRFSTSSKSKTDQTGETIGSTRLRRVRRGAGPFRKGPVAMGDKKQKPAKPGTKPTNK